MTLVSINC